MTRWIMIAMTLIGFVVAIFTHSPGILGLALLATVVGLFGTVLSLAADRVSANSRRCCDLAGHRDGDPQNVSFCAGATSACA